MDRRPFNVATIDGQSLRAAATSRWWLSALGDRGAKLVRVESGGVLIGALLRDGLVDEVSLLVHPCLSDGTGHSWFGGSVAPASA